MQMQVNQVKSDMEIKGNAMVVMMRQASFIHSVSLITNYKKKQRKNQTHTQTHYYPNSTTKIWPCNVALLLGLFIHSFLRHPHQHQHHHHRRHRRRRTEKY